MHFWQFFFTHFEDQSRTEHVRGKGVPTFCFLTDLGFDLYVKLFRQFRKMIQKCAKVLFYIIQTKCEVLLEFALTKNQTAAEQCHHAL